MRSLDDFFGSTRTASSRVDDIFATDFDSDWAVSRVLNDRERELVNKGLAHLTTVRVEGPQRWKLDLCLKAVDLFGNFLDGLELHQPSVRGWFKAERATVTFRRF